MFGIQNRCSYKVFVLCFLILSMYLVIMKNNSHIDKQIKNMLKTAIESGINTLNVHVLTLGSSATERDNGTTLENIRIFNITSNAIAYQNKCKKASLRIPDGSSTPICVYEPKEDIHVSASIVKLGWWEQGNVEKVWNLMTPVNDMQFLDIGCNIGAFTITIAKLGRRITAVDANKVNLKMLATSLRLGGLETKVTLIWNGVSNETKYMNLRPGRFDMGGTAIVKATVQDPVDRENTIIAVRLDDMLSIFEQKPFFIKMDIEAHEDIALQGAVAFFKEFDVRYVLIEWMHFKKKATAGQFILDFFNQRSFKPFVPLNQQVLELKDAYTTWPVDVLWIRSN